MGNEVAARQLADHRRRACSERESTGRKNGEVDVLARLLQASNIGTHNRSQGLSTFRKNCDESSKPTT